MSSAMLAAFLFLGSLPPFPVPLATGAPQVRLQAIWSGPFGSGCSPAVDDADAIAETLGYALPEMDCTDGFKTVTLDRQSVVRPPAVPNLIAYSEDELEPFGDATINSLFRVPGEIPFAAASSNIVAYVKPDAMMVSISPAKVVSAAFALEDMGLTQKDMSARWDWSGGLLVRVHPATVTQLVKIVQAVESTQKGRKLQYQVMPFVSDCNATIAALDALALAIARERTNVMARAAGTTLGGILGVVDPGGAVHNAFCGGNADSTLDQLVTAMHKTNGAGQMGNETYATVTHTLSAAWQLKLPPNPPGTPVYGDGYFLNYTHRLEQLLFVADGNPFESDAVANDWVQPDRALVLVPGRYDQLRDSLYREQLTFATGPQGNIVPAIKLEAQSSDGLARQLADARAYLATLNVPMVMPTWFGLTDCRAAVDEALFLATKSALAKIQGHRLRFLEQTHANVQGPFGCRYEPLTNEWASPVVPGPDSAFAGVLAGY